MNSWTQGLLWAAKEVKGDPTRLDGYDLLWGLVYLTAVLLALWGGARYLARRERARRMYSPRGLFQRLCEAHALDRGSCRALWQLAQQEQLEHPARVFLEPERIDRACEAISQDAETYRKLKARLFGES